ncbi:hypothetical protein [Gracilimonas mengyeensis]|uniref:Predicted dehydrogenase n=1 Tax=Gracilimonas mengyeensis TaxID=1302730 RepID=A0A521DBS6_9BACT|nr:hypothetical protein [Gracilimonas mengyeensis]SMO69177.1 Predicted dehydrogenase [Gracilimonas mengyeensis]
MKVGIVGDAKRAAAWEQHLRPHRIVEEVELCPKINEVGNVDACLLIDDTPDNLDILLEGIRLGLNCFLIARQPTHTKKLENIHRAAEEAGVCVQFSHWPTLAPATQWMMDQINRPTLLSITREVNYSQFLNTEEEFRHFWIDELGLCMKWIDSGIHHVEAKQITMEQTLPVTIHIFLRFDNGSTADIKIYTGASENKHLRVASSRQQLLECDAPSQKVRVGKTNSSGRLYFEKQNFDPSKAAEKAALMFLKAIQMKQEPPYNTYDAYQLAVQVDRIQQRLKQFS